MKNIIVVADKDLKSFGRELVHAISKTKIAKASLFTPKQYADNEHQIGGTQYVIFLGKNDVSKDFIPLIQKKYEKHGIVWGFDASKAVIYIGHGNVDIQNLKKEINQTKEDIKKGTESTTALLIGITAFILIPPLFIWALIQGTKDEKKLQKELQMKLGIISFLKDGFDEFIKE